MKRFAIYLAAFVIFVGVPLSAGAADEHAKSTAAKKGAADSRFIMHVAQDGMAEVELGKMANERASSQTVKEFAQRMATDHGKANQELAQLAQQKGITMPTGIDGKHKKLMDRLAKLSGADFDRAYMREMTRDHDKDVKAFQREAKQAKDADVRAWVEKTLPTLQEHQKQAKQVAASVGAAGRTARHKGGAAATGSASPK